MIEYRRYLKGRQRRMAQKAKAPENSHYHVYVNTLPLILAGRQ